MNRPLLTQALGCWLPSQVNKMLQQHLGAQVAGPGSCSSLVLVLPRLKDCLSLLVLPPDLRSLPASASQHFYHPAPRSCQYSYQCYLHNPWSAAGRIIMTTESCEGLDPPDMSWYLPPGWAAGLCRLPRGVGRAVTEHTTEPISQDFGQIRSVTALPRSIYSAGKGMGIKHTFKPC